MKSLLAFVAASLFCCASAQAEEVCEAGDASYTACSGSYAKAVERIERRIQRRRVAVRLAARTARAPLRVARVPLRVVARVATAPVRAIRRARYVPCR